MLKHLTRQFGFFILGLGLIVVSNSIDEFTVALKGNSMQVASAVTCRANAQELALAAAVDAKMLSRFNRRQ